MANSKIQRTGPPEIDLAFGALLLPLGRCLSTSAFTSHSSTFFHRPASPTRVILIGASPAPTPSIRFFLELQYRRPTVTSRQNHLTETTSHDKDPISTSIGNNQPPSTRSPWTPPSPANPSSFYSQVPTRCWVRMRLPKAQVAKLVEESSDSGEAAEKIMKLCVANGTEMSGGSATKRPKEVWLSHDSTQSTTCVVCASPHHHRDAPRTSSRNTSLEFHKLTTANDSGGASRNASMPSYRNSRSIAR